jgi:hypothetical protein
MLLTLAVRRAEGSQSRFDRVLALASASFVCTINTNTTSYIFMKSYTNPRTPPSMTTDIVAQVEFAGYVVTGVYCLYSRTPSVLQS